MPHWAAKRDATEAGIVQALRQAGALVIHLDVFDLLVLFRGRVFMLDAKSNKRRRSTVQAALIQAGWPLVYVETPEDALQAIGAIR